MHLRFVTVERGRMWSVAEYGVGSAAFFCADTHCNVVMQLLGHALDIRRLSDRQMQDRCSTGVTFTGFQALPRYIFLDRNIFFNVFTLFLLFFFWRTLRGMYRKLDVVK